MTDEDIWENEIHTTNASPPMTKNKKGCIKFPVNLMGVKKTLPRLQKKEADYVPVVKGNHKELKYQIEKLFSITPVKAEYNSIELGHGRIEHRLCEVVANWGSLTAQSRGRV